MFADDPLDASRFQIILGGLVEMQNHPCPADRSLVLGGGTIENVPFPSELQWKASSEPCAAGEHIDAIGHHEG